MKKKFVKSKKNKVFTGVLGGIAEYFQMDPTVVRIVFILMFIVSRGTGICLYLVLAFLMKEDTQERAYGHRNEYYEKNNYSHRRVIKNAEKVEKDDWSDF